MNESSPSLPSLQVSHEAISARAAQLWESMGRPSGRDEEIWFLAERELQPAAPTPAPIIPISSATPPVATKESTRAKSAAPARKPAARSSRSAAR
ncbi:MAG: DUF2934 domain-containing protein [Opitutus sp.]